MDRKQGFLLAALFGVSIPLLISCMSVETIYPETASSATIADELPTLSTVLISTIPGPLSTPKPSPTDKPPISLTSLQESYMVLSVDREEVIFDPSLSKDYFYPFATLRDEIAEPSPYEISENGITLLFSDQRPPQYKPRLMNYDFRNKSVVQLLQMSESQYWASLNHEGDQIVFVLHSDVGSDVYMIDSDGSNLKKIPGVHKWNVGPKWSPDGNSVYFLSSSEDTTFKAYDMYKYNFQSRLTERITTKPIKISDYSFSPDGTKILFSHPQMGEDVYVMNIDGSNLQNLSNSYSRDTGARWSPDGSKIVFQSDRDGNWEIYLMNSDGSEQHRLTHDSEIDVHGIWSPNGDYIAFDSERTGMRQTYVLILEDEFIHQLTYSRNGSYLHFIWAPIANVDIQFTCYIGMFELDRTLRITSEGNNLSLRETPSLEGNIVELLSSGDEVTIFDGPHFDDGYFWWNVEYVTEDVSGWVVENVDWFEPIESECELPEY